MRKSIDEIVQSEEFQSVVRDYRDMCLWFAPETIRPQTDVQLEQVLTAIETAGDMAAYKRIGRIRQWLPRGFRPRYSNSLPVRG